MRVAQRTFLVREQRSFRLNPIFEVEYASLKAHRHQSRIFELPLPIKVQKLGFQDQEDGTLVENEERNVRFWYVSTTDFGSVTYSPPTNPQRS